MVYIALLRGVNVGGKAMVSMATLASCFQELGFDNVQTYINSGNIIFSADSARSDTLAKRIEMTLDRTFDPGIRVLVKTREELQSIVTAIPTDWVNDTSTKCDVMFLWPKIDDSKILRELPSNPDLEDICYVPGAVIWRIDRPLASKSRMTRIANKPVYQEMTIRNPNTVRKLLSLASEID